MDAVLELVGEIASGSDISRWEISDSTIVGRGGQADIVLNVPSISRHHMRLDPRSDGWVVVDLDSRNGTFVDGIATSSEPVRLRDGSELTLAGAVTIRFRDPMATPLAPAIGRLHGVWIDPANDAVWVDARRVDPPLTARQFALLKRLVDANGGVVDRSELVVAAWGEDVIDGVSDDALSALIKRTRKRLAEFEINGPVIDVVKHRGVRIRA